MEKTMSQTKLKVIENHTMDKENRTKSLEAAVSLIEKNYGKGSIMKLGSKTNVDIEAISTGSLGLDIALGIGGVPKGRIIEIYVYFFHNINLEFKKSFDKSFQVLNYG